jgi:hypothetical protein
MCRLIPQHRLLLQLLVFIFGMNAAVGYGACCVDISDTQNGSTQLEEVAVSDNLPPCHKKAVESVAEELSLDLADGAFENCCAACVTAIPLKQLESAPTDFEAQDYLTPFSFYVFSNIETPYRPPSRSIS